MNKRDFEKEFDKCFFNMDYVGALEVIGAMKYAGASGTRYLEMLVYYEQGAFEKVWKSLKNKRLEKVEERELYLASLVELHLYDEFDKVYNCTTEPISAYCLYYIAGLLVKQGKSLPGEHMVDISISTYFERRYRWFISNQLADIYNINEERIVMIEAEMDEKDIRDFEEEMAKQLETVRISDSFLEEIKTTIEKKEHIPVEHILYFPWMYCAPRNKLNEMDMRFESLCDIVNYLELCRRINYSGVELEALVEYGKELTDAAHTGNEYVLKLLKDIYIDVGYYRRYELNENGDTIADLLASVIKNDAPYVIQEIDNHTMDKTVESVLSPRGVFAYNAARWQFCNTVGCEYGTRDAGMLCLSYMRILELEINEKIIMPLCERYSVKQEYDAFIQTLEPEDQENFSKVWEYLINNMDRIDVQKHFGLEMGPIFSLFDSMSDGRFKRKSYNTIFADKIKQEIENLLTDSGVNALRKGVLAKMVKPAKREKYRNPPAHTRYVGLETALECRRYVEEELLNLSGYVK